MSWKCPLNGKSDCNTPHGIGIDGGLRHIGNVLPEDLNRLGWHRVDYPKRAYFWEYDKQHPSYREREKIGMDEEDNILKVDVL